MPNLVLIMGCPGVGKTTLAKEYLKRYRYVYLDNNFIADAIDPNSRTSDYYLKFRPFIYPILYRVALENLRVGNSVLLDVPHVTHMQKREWHAEIAEIANSGGSGLKIVRCYCSETILKKRIKDRGKERDQEKLDNWSAFMEKEPLRVPIPLDHIEIDTEIPIVQQINLVSDYLGDK